MAKIDLKALSDEALVHHELSMERKYVIKRFGHRTNQLEDTASLRVVRREIARTRTEERAREAAGALAKDSLRSNFRHTFKPDQAGAAKAVAAPSGGFLSGIASRFGIGGGDAGEPSSDTEGES